MRNKMRSKDIDISFYAKSQQERRKNSENPLMWRTSKVTILILIQDQYYGFDSIKGCGLSKLLSFIGGWNNNPTRKNNLS